MNEPQRQVIASRLRLAREMAGLSQGQVAKQLGLHRPSVTEMEAGRRRVAAEELSSMARLYGVSESWLLDSPAAGDNALDSRTAFAARELAKLSPEGLDRVLHLLVALRREGPEPER